MTPAGKVTVLWNFTGGADGGYPCAGLEEDDDGTLWGDTMVGGAFGYGTEFSIDDVDDDFDVTYDYDDTHGNNPDFSPFLGGDGFMYGETNEGGSSGYGTFYMFDPMKPTKLQVISLTGVDGASPPAASSRRRTATTTPPRNMAALPPTRASSSNSPAALPCRPSSPSASLNTASRSAKAPR